MTTIKIRPAQPADIEAILEIQQSCYSAIEPESRLSMLSKIIHSPQTSFVAQIQGDTKPVAYLLALPWTANEPPTLNQIITQLPQSPDCLYLHDLAVSPKAQGTGAGSALVKHLLITYQSMPMNRLCLIAIQNARSYWERFGFQEVCPLHAQLQAKVHSYGNDAVFMYLGNSARQFQQVF